MRTETTRTLAATIVLAFALAFGFASSAGAQDASAADWLSLKKDVFGDREIATGDGKIQLGVRGLPDAATEKLHPEQGVYLVRGKGKMDLEGY